GTGPRALVDGFRGLVVLATVAPYTAASFEGYRRYRVAWAGSRVRGRDRLTIWDGHLELSAGRILDAIPFAMENPEKGIVERSATRVRFISNTTGDDDGVDLVLDAPDSAVLRLRTPVIDLDMTLGDLADGSTRTFPAGGVDLRVFLRRLPARDETRELRFDYTDASPLRGGTHAYWIRA